MAERQTLLDAILVGLIENGRATQITPALRLLGLTQVPSARIRAQHFAAGRNFEPLGRGLLGFDAFRTSHK